jgi:SAM-dependent methyltransferase
MKLEPYTRRELFEQIPDLENKTILDLASGAFCLYGLTYLEVLGTTLGKDEVKRYENNVVAIDLEYDPSFGSFLDGTSIRGDAKYLPFRSQRFNIVAAGKIFNYFRKNYDELSRIFDEIDRVLNKDGYLIGDITLFPPLSPNRLLRPHKIALYWTSYKRQIKKYSELIEEKRFKFLRKGIGFMSDEITNSLKMFFVTQKE